MREALLIHGRYRPMLNVRQRSSGSNRGEGWKDARLVPCRPACGSGSGLGSGNDREFSLSNFIVWSLWSAGPAFGVLVLCFLFSLI